MGSLKAGHLPNSLQLWKPMATVLPLVKCILSKPTVYKHIRNNLTGLLPVFYPNTEKSAQNESRQNLKDLLYNCNMKSITPFVFCSNMLKINDNGDFLNDALKLFP